MCPTAQPEGPGILPGPSVRHRSYQTRPESTDFRTRLSPSPGPEPCAADSGLPPSLGLRHRLGGTQPGVVRCRLTQVHSDVGNLGTR